MSEVTDAASEQLRLLRDAEVHGVQAAVVLTETTAGVRLRRVDLAHDALLRMTELAGAFRDDLVERVPIDYGFERRAEPHEVVAVGADEATEATRLTAELDRIEEHERLDLAKRESNQARLFVVDTLFAAADEVVRAVFVRSGVRSEIVTPSKRTSMVFSNGVYDVVDGGQLVLKDNYDAVILGDVVLGLTASKLETAFKFTTRIFEAARRVVDDHLRTLRIDGIDELSESCVTHSGMARKAASIGRKIEDVDGYAEAMQMDGILAFIDKRATVVKVETVDRDDGRFLIHDHADRSKQWTILKLLDDDYLTSELTSTFYEAPSKSRPE